MLDDLWKASNIFISDESSSWSISSSVGCDELSDWCFYQCVKATDLSRRYYDFDSWTWGMNSIDKFRNNFGFNLWWYSTSSTTDTMARAEVKSDGSSYLSKTPCFQSSVHISVLYLMIWFLNLFSSYYIVDYSHSAHICVLGKSTSNSRLRLNLFIVGVAVTWNLKTSADYLYNKIHCVYLSKQPHTGIWLFFRL